MIRNYIQDGNVSFSCHIHVHDIKIHTQAYTNTLTQDI